MICPRCKSRDHRLYIHDVATTVEVFVDGADVVGDLEWSDTNPATCSCGWEGTVGQLLDGDVVAARDAVAHGSATSEQVVLDEMQPRPEEDL